MIIDSGISKEHDQGFILDEGKLRKIVEIIDQHSAKKPKKPTTEFTVYRQDDSFYMTSSVDAVLVDDNAPGKKILALVIDLIGDPDTKPQSKEPPRLCRLRFRTHRQPNVDFVISDPDRDWCFLLAEDLGNQLQRILRPKKFPWLRRNPIVLEMGVLFILIAITLAIMGYHALQGTPGLSDAQIARLTIDEKITKLLIINRYGGQGLIGMAIGSALMIFVLIAVEWRPITKLLNWFDRSFFYWGDEKQSFDRYTDRITRVKWGVIIAFLVSLAAGLIVALAMPR
jgi:hypothetical protein